MRRAEGTIHVFTFKEGLLSRVAHDLRLELQTGAIALDGESVRAEVALEGLRVNGVMRDGVLQQGVLDAGQRSQIERAARTEVLATSSHPYATYVGRATPALAGFRVEGELSLSGHKRPLSFAVSTKDGAYVTSFEIVPSQFGIEPYKAMLGAIRLKDRVRIEIVMRELEEAGAAA